MPALPHRLVERGLVPRRTGTPAARAAIPASSARRPRSTASTSSGTSAVVLPASHPLAGRSGLRLDDLVDARWLDAPAAGLPLDQLRGVHGGPAGRGFRTALRYEGTDTRTLAALAAAGHGLALLPAPVAADVPGATAVPLVTPRLVHRTELLLLAGSRTEPTGPVAEFIRRLKS
ncbi:LysR substrate-binding domain-containing protein [Streptomyces sp. SJL17-1]|uniref:LysR substrate-binding domain-containing protein n=1 Tax=Streptomyces sp. SJL17-1 TaxID=2967223 RepID=UPI00398FF1C0